MLPSFALPIVRHVATGSPIIFEMQFVSYSDQGFRATIDLNTSAQYNFKIYWGDGSSETVSSPVAETISHDYLSPVQPVYVIEIYGELPEIGEVTFSLLP